MRTASCLAVVFVILGCVGSMAHADDKKSTPAKPAATPSKPAATSASHPAGASGAAHGSTAGGTSHGTSATGTSHGATTSSPGGTRATSGGSHGPTTSNPSGRSKITTSNPTGGKSTATAGGGGHGANAATTRGSLPVWPGLWSSSGSHACGEHNAHRREWQYGDHSRQR